MVGESGAEAIETEKNPIHWSFWLISSLSLVWHLMGCVNFLMQIDPDVVARMPESHQSLIEFRPAWATSAFAMAVFGGALGSLLLIVKNKISFLVFVLALAAVFVTQIPNVAVVGYSIKEPFEVFMMILSPFIVGIFLVWYSKYCASRGWIS